MSKEALPEQPHILVILMGALGDVVRGLSIIDRLKAFRPHAKVTWLVEPGCSGIVQLHSGVDNVIVFERKRWLTGFFSLVSRLAKERFDITLDLQRHSKSGLFSFFSRAPRRVGFHRNDSKEGNWLFNTEHLPEQGDTLPKIDHYHLFLNHIGVPKGEVSVKPLSDITLSTLPDSVKGKITQPYFGLVLGSSWESKDWPEEGYQGLVSLLLTQTNHMIALLGDKSKTAMGERLLQAANSERVVNFAGSTDLRSLIGLLRSAAVVIGPDSGPGHISGAVGTPHVTLFGPTPIGRNAPRGSESLTLSSLVGCAPCRKRVCPGLGGVCMRLLSPQAVFDKVQEGMSIKSKNSQ